MRCVSPHKSHQHSATATAATPPYYMYVKMLPQGLSSKPLKGINVGKAGLLTYRPV